MIVDWGWTSLIEGSQQAKSNKQTDKYGSDNSFGIQISSGRESRKVSSLLFSCFSSGRKPEFSVAVENLLNGLSPRVPLSPVESRWVPLSPAGPVHMRPWIIHIVAQIPQNTHTSHPLSSSVRLLNDWGLTIPSSMINSPIKLLFLLVYDSFECLLIKEPHIQTYKSDWFHSAATREFEFWVLAVVAECAKQSCT